MENEILWTMHVKANGLFFRRSSIKICATIIKEFVTKR